MEELCMFAKFKSQNLLYKISVPAVFFLALFLRVYHLTQTPDILHLDEASIGYNAWCIAHYGVDRYLNAMPVYAQNLNGGQSPLYTYAVALLLKVFGGDGIPLFLVRLPGAISSMLVVIWGTRIISLIFRSKKVTVMCALLITICPYFIMHGRFALDCNLMLSCSLIALHSLLKYINTQKNTHLIICGVCFGITLYTYALSYFVIPIFLSAAAIYLLYTKKISISRILIWAAAVCITALPIILFIISLLFRLPAFRFLCFTIRPVAEERMNDISNAGFWSNIMTNIRLTLTNSFYPLDAVGKYFTMYYISIPFIILGFFCSTYHFILSLIRKSFHYSSIMLLFYLSGLVTIGLVSGSNIYRANYFFASYIYFLVLGIVSVYHFVKLYRKLFIYALALCYLLWGLSFLRYYFNVYSVLELYTYPHSLYFAPAGEPVSFVENELNADSIYCDCVTMSVFYFFYKPVSPYEFSGQNFDEMESFDHHYFEINYYTPVAPGNAYIVRKENSEFITQLYLSDTEFDTWEYDRYYVFFCR